MTLRTILVPVRGDGKGERVLDHALAVARRFNAHIAVVHCRPRPEDMMPFGVFVPSRDPAADHLVGDHVRRSGGGPGQGHVPGLLRRHDLAVVAGRRRGAT